MASLTSTMACAAKDQTGPLKYAENVQMSVTTGIFARASTKRKPQRHLPQVIPGVWLSSAQLRSLLELCRPASSLQ